MHNKTETSAFNFWIAICGLVGKILFCLLFFSFSSNLFAQISIPSSTPVTENFNGIGSTATAALPANWKMTAAGAGSTANWSTAGNVTATTVAQCSGTLSAGGRYNWATTGCTADRSIGFMTSGSYASPNGILAFYRNTSGSTITELAISYNIERYRVNTATFSLAFFTSTDGSTWTAQTAGDIGTGVFATGASAFNYSPQQTESKSFSITGLNITNNSDVYLKWVFTNTGSSNSQGLGLDDVSVTATLGACTPATQPSSAASAVNFTNVGCNSMTINWTNSDATKHLVVVRSGAAVAGTPTDQIAYAASTTFGSGATIAANEYVVYNSTGTSVTVTGLTAGVTYHYKIFSFNGAGCPASGENYLTTTTVSASQATLPTCGCPQITGVMINSCTGTCSEGDNEIIFLNSGSYSIPVSPANIKVFYENSSPASINYTESFTTNATYVSNLNTTSGCGTLFYDASAVGTIPPNSEFLIMRSTACYSYDFTSFCGAGPIYILFSSDASWLQAGNFSNSCAPVRYFRTDFTGIGACVTDYSYDPCLLTLNGDGDAISFPAGGGAADNYFNTGCNPPPTVLPVNLVSFEGNRAGKNVDLAWITATELNNSHFTIERSVNGRDFSAAGTVSGGGTINQPKAYFFTDFKAPSEKLYYRLRQTDYDGTSVASSVISINKAGDKNSLFSVSSDANGTLLNFFDEHASRVITIIDMSGRVIFTRQFGSSGTSIALPEMFSKGLYFVSVSADGEYASEKFWQQ